mgnify:CR=1 FL=1
MQISEENCFGDWINEIDFFYKKYEKSVRRLIKVQ